MHVYKFILSVVNLYTGRKNQATLSGLLASWLLFSFKAMAAAPFWCQSLHIMPAAIKNRLFSNLAHGIITVYASLKFRFWDQSGQQHVVLSIRIWLGPSGVWQAFQVDKAATFGSLLGLDGWTNLLNSSFKFLPILTCPATFSKLTGLLHF